MAGMGPPPKAPGKRSRRNAELPMIDLPPAGRRGRVPPLPGRSKLLKSTAEWWATAWRSEMASQWHETDVAGGLGRLARLIDGEARGDTEHLAEIRQLEDRYGLNNLSRLRLRWRLPSEQPEAEAAGPRRRASGERVDPRRLRVVPGGS